MASRFSGWGVGLRLVLLLIGAALVLGRAEALEWRWSYEGAGVSALRLLHDQGRARTPTDSTRSPS